MTSVKINSYVSMNDDCSVKAVCVCVCVNDDCSVKASFTCVCVCV